MNAHTAGLLLLGSAHLLAQGAIRSPQPFPVLPTIKSAPGWAAPQTIMAPAVAAATRLPAPIAAPRNATEGNQPPAVSRPRGVLFDDRSTPLWAGSETWKASFDPTGMTFVPFLGAAAPRNLPVHFGLRSVSLGGKATPLAAGEVRRAGNLVTIDRGTVRERYAAQAAGLEQSFVFDTLPQRGELCVQVGVRGEFAVHTGDDGFVLQHELGSFCYGKALAIDAAGNRLELVTSWTGDAFSIQVPAAFVDAATLPLVIDPLVGNVTTVQAASVPVSSSDIAYDATLHQFVVSWDWTFSQTDTDVFAQRYDESMNPIGQALVVDSSTQSWSKSRIAGLNLPDKFLVVAESRTAPNATAQIRGVLIEGATGATSAPLLLASSTSNLLNPDVGGDPMLIGPTFFTVVFEREWSPTDHDIQYVQVDHLGSLRGPTAAIDTSTAFEHSPRISKCDGQGPIQQFWAIVYRRDQATTGQTRAALVRWDGILQQIGGTVTQPLDVYAAPAGPIGLDVSSPDAAGRFLAVDTLIDPASQNRYLRGLAFDNQGAVVASGNMSNPFVADYQPSIDCDGTRFAIAYVDNSSYAAELAVATCDLVDQQILSREALFVTQNVVADHTGGLVALHSGGAGTAGDREYGLTWTSDGQPGGTVFAQRYRGMGPGGFGFRANGCGALTWSIQGQGAIGEHVALQLLNTAGLCGWAFGASSSVPLGFCPGCTQGTSADVVLAGSLLQWHIPLDPHFVGMTFALQGFDFAAGTCLGSLALSHTVDLTIR